MSELHMFKLKCSSRSAIKLHFVMQSVLKRKSHILQYVIHTVEYDGYRVNVKIPVAHNAYLWFHRSHTINSKSQMYEMNNHAN